MASESKFQHFTVIADGIVGQLKSFTCSPGPAFMSMQVWAKSIDHKKIGVKSFKIIQCDFERLDPIFI